MIDPLQDGISEIEYIQHCGNDRMIVNAARVSYANDLGVDAPLTKRDEDLILYLLRHKHESPLEHTLVTFRVKAPLYVIQEMLRHRIGVSVNQKSARYSSFCEEPEPMRRFYCPPNFRYQSKSNKQGSCGVLSEDENNVAREIYTASCLVAFENYERLRDMGVCRELARGVLPHSTYSELYYTVNLRSLLHFLRLRISLDAQQEIRAYALRMLDIVRPFFPATFRALDILEAERGSIED